MPLPPISSTLYTKPSTITPPPWRHGTYIDDVTVGGEGVPDTWKDMLQAMERLTTRGFPLNAGKLKLLMRTISISQLSPALGSLAAREQSHG